MDCVKPELLHRDYGRFLEIYICKSLMHTVFKTLVMFHFSVKQRNNALFATHLVLLCIGEGEGAYSKQATDDPRKSHDVKLKVKVIPSM